MSETNQVPFNNVMWCPHCEGTTQFNLEFPILPKELGSRPKVEVDKLLGPGTFEDRQEIIRHYFIWRCIVCDGLVFVAKQVRLKAMVTEGIYPNKIAAATKFRKLVPEDVLVDFEEAIKCFQMQAYRASAAMCRRALQSSVTDQRAPKGKLQDQIDGLHESSPDRITTAIKDWAHTIRIFGNWGAHPDDDGLKDVDEKLASEVIEFLSNFFQYVYVMPSKVAQAQAKRDATKKAP